MVDPVEVSRPLIVPHTKVPSAWTEGEGVGPTKVEGAREVGEDCGAGEVDQLYCTLLLHAGHGQDLSRGVEDQVLDLGGQVEDDLVWLRVGGGALGDVVDVVHVDHA